MRLSVLSVLLCYWSVAVLAQPPRGRVVDAQTQATLPFATIEAVGLAGVGVQTDVDGQFQWSLEVRPDSLRCSYLGYAPQTIPFESEMAFRLQPIASEITPVTVRAERLVAREFATEALGQLDIYRQPAAKADPLLAVNALPAATNTDETANVALRGSLPGASTVFLEGVPIDDAVKLDQPDGPGQFSIFNTALVRKLTVYPSNPPIELGQSAGGAVAIEFPSEVRASGQSLSASMVGVGYSRSRSIGEKAGSVFFSNLQSHHLLKAFNASSLQSLKRFNTLDAGYLLTGQPNDQTAWKIFSYGLLERYRYQTRFLSTEQPFDQRKARLLTVASFDYRWDRWRVQGRQGLAWSTADYDFGNIQTNPRRWFSFTSGTLTYAGTKWQATAGGVLRLESSQTEGRAPAFEYAIRAEDASFSYESKSELAQTEAFTYLKYRPTTQWAIGGGIRHGRAHDRGESLTSWQLNGFYQPGKSIVFRLGYGHYGKYLPPSSRINDFSLLESRQLSVDVRWQQDPWTLQLAAYRHVGRSELLRNPVQGLEAYLSYNKNRLFVQLSAATIQSVFEESDIRYPAPADLSYLATLQARIDLPADIQLGTFLRARPGTFYQPLIDRQFDATFDQWLPVFAELPDGALYPDYLRLDLNINRTFVLPEGSLIAFASLNNVLDTRNVRSYYYDDSLTDRRASYFGRRVWFLGVVFQW